jgi:endonuclease/exonuclease/phosphatase family metal-dependent hydrolase
MSEGWKIIGAGDFNNDGETDILLRHSSRSLAFWLIKAPRSNRLGSFARAGRLAAIGLGDFNQDGYRHHAAPPRPLAAFWFMNGMDIPPVSSMQQPDGQSSWQDWASR